MLVLVVAALAVGRGSGAQEVREYVGAFTPHPDLAEGTVIVNRARFVASTSGLGADLVLRVSFPPTPPSAPPPEGGFGDFELFPDGVCVEFAVNTLTAPAPIDTTTPDPQPVADDIDGTLGLAPMPCASAPSTLETEAAPGLLDVTLSDELVDGRLVFDTGVEFTFQVPRSGSTTVPPTTGGTGGPTSPGGAGLEELLAGSSIRPETGRELVRRSGCETSVEPEQLSAACREALEVTNDFRRSIDGLVTREIQDELSTAVIVGSMRGRDGNLLVPSIGRLLPVILQLAAQANAGDADALVAMRRLFGALVTIDLGALS